MTLARFRLTWREHVTWLRILLAASTVMLIANLVLAVALIRRESYVVLVPPDLDKRVTVARAKADQGYLESWGYYLATLLGNITPSTAEFIRARIEPLLDPGITRDVITVLEQQLDQIRRDRVTLRFEPKRTTFEPETAKVFVTGTSFVEAAAGTRDSQIRTYEFTIRMRNFGPLIDHLATYPGNPRTQDVIEREAKEAS